MFMWEISVWEMANDGVCDVTKDDRNASGIPATEAMQKTAVEIIASYKTEQYVGDKSQLFSRNWDLLFRYFAR